MKPNVNSKQISASRHNRLWLLVLLVLMLFRAKIPKQVFFSVDTS